MTSIFDHVGFSATDFDKSKSFYTEVLGTLGIKLLADWTFDDKHVAGFGVDRPTFWLSSGKKLRGDTHLAFRARSHAEVNAFYSVALSVGGTDNGAPGPRPHYHADYYGAFVLDPDGNNIEAVCHEPE